MIDDDEYTRCHGPLCARKVKVGVVFCCTGCARGYKEGYEVHEGGLLGHSALCDARSTERGLLTPFDWQYHLPHREREQELKGRVKE